MREVVELLLPGGASFIGRITRRNELSPPKELVDNTNWLLATATTYAATTIKNAFKCFENELKLYVVGLYGDRNWELEVSFPEAERIGGDRDDPTVAHTPATSPLRQPMLVVPAFHSYRPSFTIKNASRYTMKHCKVLIGGYRYELEKADLPDTNKYATLDLANFWGKPAPGD